MRALPNVSVLREVATTTVCWPVLRKARVLRASLGADPEQSASAPRGFDIPPVLLSGQTTRHDEVDPIPLDLKHYGHAGGEGELQSDR